MNKQNINWKAAAMKMNKECKNTRSKKLKDKNTGK